MPTTEDRQLAISTTEQPPSQAADLRHAAMSLPPAAMLIALGDYRERRDTFRGWLLPQLIEGIHFGWSPGCEPKFHPNGDLKVWSKFLNNGKGGFMAIPTSQWTPKKGLYKAGADFICEVCRVRDDYKADMEAWQQLGSPTDTFVFACYLYSRETGELQGEGRGARKVGQKGGDVNNAIKMAKKCAKVDAVLNTYALSDLFTQDEEDRAQTHDNPEAAENAPEPPPERARRMTPEQITDEVKRLIGEWKSRLTEIEATPAQWATFVKKATQRDFAVKIPAAWTVDDIDSVSAALGEPQ